MRRKKSAPSAGQALFLTPTKIGALAVGANLCLLEVFWLGNMETLPMLLSLNTVQDCLNLFKI